MNDRWWFPAVCIFLAAIIWLVFGQTLGHEFVNYDDNQYVYENPVVQKGLTWEASLGVHSRHIGHWHPLTWLSHMLDCQLYGLQPGGHHLTNVLLHAANGDPAVSGAAADDGAFLWRERVCGGGVCHPSLAMWSRWPGWRSARTC